MAITDLTGYTWTAHNLLTFSTSALDDPLQVSFTDANGANYYYIQAFSAVESLFYCTDPDDPWLSSVSVYSSMWMDPNYKTITFTGGPGVTNSALISWLEANGDLYQASGTKNLKLTYNDTIIYDDSIDIPCEFKYKDTIIHTVENEEETMMVCKNTVAEDDIIFGEKKIACKNTFLSDNIYITVS